MAETTELTILQEGFVKITNLRTVIGTITYTMADIRYVNVTRRARSYRPLWLVIPGSVLIGWSIIDQTGQFMEFFNIGSMLIVVSIARVLAAKPTYAVQIEKSSGEHSILRSTDFTFIQRVAAGMNGAIAARGVKG